jgi:uncharacterized protein
MRPDTPPSCDGRPCISIVVLQPTPFCNIDCRYCYLPERSNKAVMHLGTIIAAFDRIFASGWCSSHLTVIWHAGEPLVLPVSYYQAAFEAIALMCPPGIELRHSIQSNGMLLTPEWCDFVKKWHVGLGVSIDGPRHLHDFNRVTRSGKGTFDRTIEGIRLLRREKVPFHVISVLSEKSMCSPEELLDFYVSEGIDDVCFNVEESEGAHVSGLLSSGDPSASFYHFLDRFWSLARQSSKIHFIREIDGMISRIFRPEGTTVDNSQVEPFGMINIDCRGNVSSFSPELLGYKNSDYHDFIVGNVLDDSLAEMLQSPAMGAMARDISAGVDLCRRECEYFSVCGGGAPVNKLTENGSFATSRTQFCRLIQIVPTDLILRALDRMEAGFDSVAGGVSRESNSVPDYQFKKRPSNGRDVPAADATSFRSGSPDIHLHQIQRGSR